MPQAESTIQQRRPFGATMRRDAWWVVPVLVFTGLSAFIVYSTWAAFQGAHYWTGPYVSPFYSPEIFGDSPHSWFGPKPFEQGGRVSDGRLSVGFLKRQDTGIASVVRFNGQLRLPNVEKFGYVFLGRADQRDIVTDTPAAFSRQQRLLNNRPEAPSFVAGLGWSLPRSIDLRLGFRGGLKPYAQAGYSHSEQWHYGTLAQFRQTLFWARDDHLGSTTAVSLEKPWSSSLALRWLMAATITQQAPKFDVSSLWGAYQSFGDQRLLSLEALAHGVQSSGVGLSDYGVQVKWAQPVYRSWLVVEVLGGYFWPRPEPELPRGHAWAVGGSVMMRF